MDRYYFDFSNQTDAVSIFIKDGAVFPAGTRVYAMPVTHKSAAYERFAQKYDVHFIFIDRQPQVDFYSVPFLNIFAVDSSGGMFASVASIADFESDAKISYISPDRKVYLAAENGRAFLSNISAWKENLTLCSDIELFQDLEHAKTKHRFLDFP